MAWKKNNKFKKKKDIRVWARKKKKKYCFLHLRSNLSLPPAINSTSTTLLHTCVCCLSRVKNRARALSSLDRCARHMALRSLRAASSDRRLYWAISSFLHHHQEKN